MKDATGELSMTVVVIIAVIAIVLILNVFLVPAMNGYIRNAWTNMTDPNYDGS
jgi:uncharacterized membrane protein